MPDERGAYTSVKIPKKFCLMIDELVEDKRHGFISRADVIKTAVREYYEKIKNSALAPESE